MKPPLFNVIRMDRVSTPHSPDTLITPPEDLGAWISPFPGISVLAPALQVAVGGIQATQLDVRSAEDVRFCPTGLEGADDPQWFGLAGGHDTRLTLLRVDGRTVMISEQIGVENTVGDFDAVVSGLQPLLDSIAWGP